jgi:hypothetical protein
LKRSDWHETTVATRRRRCNLRTSGSHALVSRCDRKKVDGNLCAQEMLRAPPRYLDSGHKVRRYVSAIERSANDFIVTAQRNSFAAGMESRKETASILAKQVAFATNANSLGIWLLGT